MELKARKIKADDWDMLSDWWKGHNWPVPARDSLPENGSGGIIIEENNKPTIAGFIYQTNSSVAWVDWIISNKEYRKKPQRENAIGLLIETLTGTCKNLGSKYCYALIKHRGLIETYKQLGYIEADSYTQEMIKAL